MTTYEVREAVAPQTVDCMQQLSIAGLSLLTIPLCINGRWFLPVTADESDKLTDDWHDSKRTNIQEY